jgi:N-acetylglucosaminyldiphosphoundecaprenol N-acetyl-beta-D-mannosaminyltransferase
MNKIYFEKTTKEDSYLFLQKNKERKILNFLNAHDIYMMNKEIVFSKALLDKNNINYIDGFLISAILSISNLKRIPRNRGPTFTKDFLKSQKLSRKYKHFFIGLNEEDLTKIKKKYPHLKNSFSYNPPYIKTYKFDKNEIEKISNMINSKKPDFVWVGIGSPKQNIISVDLFYKTKAKYFVNIGAALDFFLEKKQEAPLIFRELGLEWFYRLIKDFRYSYKKVARSLSAIIYINKIRIRK